MLLGTIFISILLPYQVHPSTLDKWELNTHPVVTAGIDAARLVGLPRLKTLDKEIHRVLYVNDFNIEAKNQVQTRKELIHNYFSK